MNHHSFRTVIKEMTIKEIKEQNLNPAHFKAVCMILSMYGDYESGTRIKPSWLTVAREAGVDRKTAMKVRDYLLSVGLLVKVATTEANISVYEFGELSISEDQLSINNEQLSNSSEQLSTIDGHNTTYNSTSYSTSNSNYKRNKSGNSKSYVSFKHSSISSFPDSLQPVARANKEVTNGN